MMILKVTNDDSHLIFTQETDTSWLEQLLYNHGLNSKWLDKLQYYIYNICNIWQ